MDIEEMFTNPFTYLLGGGGAVAVVIGWIAARQMEMPLMPIWQMLLMVVVCFIAGAVFANRE